MNQQTIERLKTLRLPGFVEALAEQDKSGAYNDLSFHERLSLLVEKEILRRDNNKLQTRLKNARFKLPASIDEIDFGVARGLEKKKFLELVQGGWLRSSLNLILIGPTGVGKSYLSSALGMQFCRQGSAVLYIKTRDLLSTIQAGHADGSFKHVWNRLQKNDLVIVDEWLREPLSQNQARDILDFIDDRYRKRSCIFATQYPVKTWHKQIQDPTLADAILDRIVHDSIRIELSGESMRKLTSKTKEVIS